MLLLLLVGWGLLSPCCSSLRVHSNFCWSLTVPHNPTIHLEALPETSLNAFNSIAPKPTFFLNLKIKNPTTWFFSPLWLKSPPPSSIIFKFQRNNNFSFLLFHQTEIYLNYINSKRKGHTNPDFVSIVFICLFPSMTLMSSRSSSPLTKIIKQTNRTSPHCLHVWIHAFNDLSYLSFFSMLWHLFTCVYVFIGVSAQWHPCHSTSVEVRGQFAGVGVPCTMWLTGI